MKKLFIFIIVAMFLVSSSTPLMAAKRNDNGKKCYGEKIKGVCQDDVEKDVEDCPPGWIWLDLYEFCIKV